LLPNSFEHYERSWKSCSFLHKSPAVWTFYWRKVTAGRKNCLSVGPWGGKTRSVTWDTTDCGTTQWHQSAPYPAAHLPLSLDTDLPLLGGGLTST
jgi:hypothetical protein